MTLKFPHVLLLAASLLLAACSQETRPAWQRAEAAPHLEIPAGVDTPGRSAEMVVPDADAANSQSEPVRTQPPVNINLTTQHDVATTWNLVAERIESLGVGSIVSRDDQQHDMQLDILGRELPELHTGFWSKLIHSAPDPDQVYTAYITVRSENGVTTIHLDGDGRAVLYLDDTLDNKDEASEGPVG